MKKAFTLAETLITMGIIGIVAALTLPAINQMRPDETKIKYLKAFDALQESVIEIASNKLEYPTHEEDITGNVTRVYDSPTHRAPLLHISHSNNGSLSSTPPNGPAGTNWNNNSKLCHLIAWTMNGNNDSCSPDRLQVDPPNNNQLGNVAFTTPNGIAWYMRVSRINLSNQQEQAEFAENVMIDVNGADRPNCLYNAVNCRYPDRFWFMITADGKVTPADPMGKAYIQTRKTNGRRDMTDYINTNTLRYSQWAPNTDDNTHVKYRINIRP